MVDTEACQKLLEQACRQTLRELANGATEPEVGGSAPSIECIVRNVTSRILSEANTQGLQLAKGKSSPGPSQKEPEEALLNDLSARPWVIWREQASLASQGHSSPRLPIVHGFASAWGPGRLGAHGSLSTRRCPGVHSVPGSPNLSPRVGSRPVSDAQDSNDMFLEHAEESDDETETDCSQSGPSVPEEDRPCRKRLGAFQRLRKPLQVKVKEINGLNASDTPSTPPPHPIDSVSLLCSPKFNASHADDGTYVVRNGMTLSSNSTQQLLMKWQGRPRAVLLVVKPGDRIVMATLQDMAAWLSSQGIAVVLEPQLLSDQPQLKRTLRSTRSFSKADRLERAIDLVITIGGDGTLTWAVSLFDGAMPPVLSFAAGSLGFLTPFPVDSWIRTLTRLLDLHQANMPLPLVCRMRLKVVVQKKSCTSTNGESKKEVLCLNEVLVHRGNSGSLAKLEVGVDGEKVTLVQGDGVILATPTGSTAYSLAAGGSMVHPSVPAILLTPVSPHSLSFRPALLPDSAVVTIGVPLHARCGAVLSVDGKDCCHLDLGDSIEVAMSSHPVPTICQTTDTQDWFASVQQGLQWNGRMEQKSN